MQLCIPYIRTFPYFAIGTVPKVNLTKVVAILRLLFSLRMMVETKTRIAKDTFLPLDAIGLHSYDFHIFASNCVNFDL